jgi:hypothetical protein
MGNHGRRKLMADMPGWIWTTHETRMRELARRRRQSTMWADPAVWLTVVWLGLLALVLCSCMDTTEVVGPQAAAQQTEIRLTECASYADTHWEATNWEAWTGKDLEGLACGWDLLNCDH